MGGWGVWRGKFRHARDGNVGPSKDLPEQELKARHSAQALDGGRTPQQQQQAWGEAQALPLSLDLISAARHYLTVLRAVDGFPSLTSHPPTVRRAVARYWLCWMPMLAEEQKRRVLRAHESKDLGLFPPLDVLWVWVCHRLNPVAYHKHCLEVHGQVLDCPESFLLTTIHHGDSGSTGNQEEESSHFQSLVEEASEAWADRFPNEPFHLPMLWPPPADGHLSPETLTASLGAKDLSQLNELEAAVLRQASFGYQVARPHFWEEEFLQSTLMRYKAFLYTMQQQEKLQLGLFCVPTYDIDLMWHAHQLCPSAYEADCRSIFGAVKNHDDTDQDRSHGSKLNKGYQRTSQLWESLFGTCYPKAGCLYRGAPPTPLPVLLPEVQQRIQARMGCIGPLSLLGPSLPTGGAPQESDREVFEVVVHLKGLHNAFARVGGLAQVFVRVEALEHCPGTLFKSGPLLAGPYSPVHLNFSFRCSKATRGLRFSLCRKRLKSTVVAGLEFTWERVLTAPGQMVGGVFPCIPMQREVEVLGMKLERAVPSLSLCITATAPSPGNALLAMLPSVTVDKEGVPRTPARVLTYGSMVVGADSWRTRTVLDHSGRAQFILRLHKGTVREEGHTVSVVGYSGQARRVASDPQTGWQEIRLYRGGWDAGRLTQNPLIVVQGSAESPSCHSWKCPGLWELTIHACPKLHGGLGPSVVAQDHASHAGVMGINFTGDNVPAMLVPGRALEFSSLLGGTDPGASVNSFYTLVRFPKAAGFRGKATALLNFRTGVVEVAPQEDAGSVLLLCAALGVSAPMLCARVNPVGPVQQVIKWRARAHASHILWLGKDLNENRRTQWGSRDPDPWYSYSDSVWYKAKVPGTVLLGMALGASAAVPFGYCGAGVCGSFAGGACGGDGWAGSTGCPSDKGGACGAPAGAVVGTACGAQCGGGCGGCGGCGG